MNDKLDHFVLEYDDERGLALLAMTETGGGRVAAARSAGICLTLKAITYTSSYL